MVERAGGRLHPQVAGGDLAVGDVGRLEGEHGVALALGVDGGAERHPARGVPGQLGGAEQPAVVLRRDPHGVARLPAGAARPGARERPGPREAVQAAAHVGEAQPVAVAGRVPAARQRAREDLLGAGVVDAERVLVDRDLGVARVGLQLEPRPAVAADPDAPRRAGR